MKKFFFILICIIANFSIVFSQNYIRPNYSYGYEYFRMKFDSVLHVPNLNDTLLHTKDTTPQIRVIGAQLKYYAHGYWRLASGSGTNHNPVTIGTSNGLNITTGQVLSSDTVTPSTNGAMTSWSYNQLKNGVQYSKYLWNYAPTDTVIKVRNAGYVGMNLIGSSYTNQLIRLVNSAQYAYGIMSFNTGQNGISAYFSADGSNSTGCWIQSNSASSAGYNLRLSSQVAPFVKADSAGTVKYTVNTSGKITSAKYAGTGTRYLLADASGNIISGTDATSSSTGSNRGYYDASTNVFPSTGGSGTSGAILKGDYWTISVQGVLGGDTTVINSRITAMFDSPGQTFSNWNILQAGLGFTPENSQNKMTTYNSTYLNSKTKYPSMWFLNNYYSLDSIIINPVYKYRKYISTNNGTNNYVVTNSSGGYNNYVTTNNGTNNYVGINNSTNNWVLTNSSGAYTNFVSTNNGINNYVVTNSSGGYNNYVTTNNGTNNYVVTNSSGGYNNYVITNNGINNYVGINNSTNNWVSINNKYVNKIDSAYSSTSHVNESCAMDTVSNTSGLTTANFGKNKCHTVFDGFGHGRLIQSKSPTITLGTGAGTGATYTLILGSTDKAGVIQVTTGTSPNATGEIFRITYAYPYKGMAVFICVPADSNSASVQGQARPHMTGYDPTYSGLTASGTALSASTTYTWHYYVAQ